MLTISSPTTHNSAENEPKLGFSPKDAAASTGANVNASGADGTQDPLGSKRARSAGEEGTASFSAPECLESADNDSSSTSSSNSNNGRTDSSASQGPLIASVGANGEHEGDAEHDASTENEEALIAQQTDMLAPKAAVPELRHRSRDNLESGGLRRGRMQSPDSGATAVNDKDGFTRGMRNDRFDNGAVILGPMEPMQPLKPANGQLKRKKLPPLSAGFPTVPGLPNEDPSVHSGPMNGSGSHGSTGYLPSLVENAMGNDTNRHIGSPFGPGTNIMADMYTQPTNGTPYLHGVTSMRGRPANSTTSRVSGWDQGERSASVPASGFASSANRNSDPRFSYTYPHGMLTGPAGIVPDGHDQLGPLHSQFNNVGAPMMMGSGMLYQPSQGPIQVMAPGVAPAPSQQPQQQQHQQHQQQPQPLTTTAYPVMLGTQGYTQMPMPAFSGGVPETVAPDQPMHLPQMLREAQATPASRAGHSSAKTHSYPPNSSEPRTYHCTYPGCDWSFVRSSDQKRHIRSHEKPSLQCPYWEIHTNCNRKDGLFYRLDVLKRHLRLVHLIRPTNGTDDGGTCRVCGKEFEHTRDFISHCEACAAAAKESKLSAKAN